MRLADHEPLRQAARLLALLPAPGACLQELAATVVGEAHGLDLGRPLAAVVLRAGRLWTVVDLNDRRQAWAAVGVELDQLSASVLGLGLRVAGDGLLARMSQACAGAGEPCRLTLRQLRRAPAVVEDEGVFMCENPAAVLTAADRLGPRCKPLVCVEGLPGSAARVLLAALGPRVRYHGDFDWMGPRIAADVPAQTGGLPWRFDAAACRRVPNGMELLEQASTQRGIRSCARRWSRRGRRCMRRRCWLNCWWIWTLGAHDWRRLVMRARHQTAAVFGGAGISQSPANFFCCHRRKSCHLSELLFRRSNGHFF